MLDMVLNHLQVDKTAEVNTRSRTEEMIQE